LVRRIIYAPALPKLGLLTLLSAPSWFLLIFSKAGIEVGAAIGLFVEGFTVVFDLYYDN